MRNALLHPSGLGLLLVSLALAGVMPSTLDRWSGQAYWIILLGILGYAASVAVLSRRATVRGQPSGTEETGLDPPGDEDSRDFFPFVQGAFRKLNTPSALSQSELVSLLPETLASNPSQVRGDGIPGELTPLEKAQALREVLITAIEQLKPPGEPTAAAAPEALQYHILHEAYVQRRPGSPRYDPTQHQRGQLPRTAAGCHSCRGASPASIGRIDCAAAGVAVAWFLRRTTETLDVEAASLPSTPFQVGDRLPAVVNIYPGVPAAIEMSFELYPIDGSPRVTGSVTGKANRFGYFDGGGDGFEFGEAGEYLVRVRATYTDAEGRLWMGIRRWGSGVASASPALIAHGRRGDDSQPTSEQLAWFTRTAIGVPAGPHHISFPYHSGDVVWATDDDSVQMRVTVQDPDGQIAVLLEERAHQSNSEGAGIRQRRVIGDLPLILSTNNGLEATFAVDAIDQWGYAYRAVERPGVRVRESIGTDLTKSPYWRFNDLYLAQRGMGSEGDLPNDIKWQFGAAVFKRPDLGIGEVAIYGSLWVEIADDDPIGSRVFPPFQGMAGRPSGGPIMTPKGQEIDLFVLPTGVRPGAILEVGDRFVFAGQVGPPLASKVTVRVTSPSGVLRTFSGQANPIGYFSDPAGDFEVEEPGVWTVDVQVVHDGLTSAGPVEPPYPTGGVLGSADGRFQVYVVPKEATQLDYGLSAFGIYALPSSMRMLFFPRIPEGWTNVDAVYAINMPGFILEEGKLMPDEEVLQVVYDPARLHADFPNIDLAGLSDEVFISVLLTGSDASGQPAFVAKHLTLVGEDIYDMN